MNTLEINNYMKGLICFKGTYPKDLIPKRKFNNLPIALIINTHPSNKSGEHWVALFITNDNKAEYFDSFGREPFKEIFEFVKLFNIKTIIYNRQIVQCLFSSNCGAYCIIYLKSRCNGISFKDFLSIYTNDRCLNDLITTSI